MSKQEIFNDAAYNGNLSVLSNLLNDVDVNGRNYDGADVSYSAIHNAVYGGQPAAVEFLIKHGALLEDNLLSICLDDFYDKNQEIAKILLKNGYQITKSDIKEYLMTTDVEIKSFFQTYFPEILTSIRKRGALI